MLTSGCDACATAMRQRSDGVQQVEAHAPAHIDGCLRIEPAAARSALADSLVQRPHRNLILHGLVARHFDRVHQLVPEQRCQHVESKTAPQGNAYEPRAAGGCHEVARTIDERIEWRDTNVHDEIGSLDLVDEPSKRRRTPASFVERVDDGRIDGTDPRHRLRVRPTAGTREQQRGNQDQTDGGHIRERRCGV